MVRELRFIICSTSDIWIRDLESLMSKISLVDVQHGRIEVKTLGKA